MLVAAPLGPLDRLLAWVFPRQSRRQRHALFAILLAWWIFFVISPSGFDVHYYYLPALRGDFDFYYPYWVRWLLAPLAWLPFPLNYWLWMSTLLAGLVLAARLSENNPWQLFFSFPFVWVLWYGQVEGFVAIGLILLWWGAQKTNLLALGVGLLLASIKPHIAGPAALFIWLGLPGWRVRTKALWLLAPLAVLSLIVFGPSWPLEWWRTINQPLFTQSYNNSSLFPWIGFAAFLLWLPALVVPLASSERLKAILATTLLTMPYVPPYSQLILYFWAMPWWQWLLGQLGWLRIFTSDDIFRFNFLFPLVFLLSVYWHAWRQRALR
jgi:hypothetical protein